jgi:hypothetical protein
LFTPYVPFVLGGRLIQLEPAVGGERRGAVTDALQLRL